MAKAARKFTKIAFVASPTDEARQAAQRLTARYGNVAEDDAEVIVALGGDGLMLETLHQHMGKRVPIYGMNRGSVGFLMNDYQEDDLHGRLAQAEINTIHPLRARMRQRGGAVQEALRHQRGFAATPDPSGRQVAPVGRWHRAHGRAQLRWRAPGDAGGIDGLQFFGLWPDPADHGE